MKITSGEIIHLAKLSKLDLAPEEIEKYRGELENIINFLDALEGAKNPTGVQKSDAGIQLFTQQESFENPNILLQNTKHPITHHTISIKTPLNH